MDIKIKEPLYLAINGQQYVVRQGTNGVERNRVVYFYDITKTFAVGFSRDYCLDNPHTFQVAKTLSDKEVYVRDVLRVIDEANLPEQKMLAIQERIKSL